MKDKKIANKFIKEKLTFSDTKTFCIPYILTAAKVGIDNKNEIFEDSTLSNLSVLAAVIAIPERLTPGISANTCKKPIYKADLNPKPSLIFLVFSNLSLI